MRKVTFWILAIVTLSSLVVVPAIGAPQRTVAMLTPYMASVTTNQMIKVFEAGSRAKGWQVITIDTDMNEAVKPTHNNRIGGS